MLPVGSGCQGVLCHRPNIIALAVPCDRVGFSIKCDGTKRSHPACAGMPGRRRCTVGRTAHAQRRARAHHGRGIVLTRFTPSFVALRGGQGRPHAFCATAADGSGHKYARPDPGSPRPVSPASAPEPSRPRQILGHGPGLRRCKPVPSLRPAATPAPRHDARRPSSS